MSSKINIQTSSDPASATSNPVKSTRHILSLSGGKDSTALAIYMKDRVAGMEYVFCDTGKELKETYAYLDKVEAYLGTPITVLLNDQNAFDNLLEMRRGFLPSPRMRWCTEQLKLKPFERFVGDDPVVSYVGIRADENRKGHISTKTNITTRMPFVEDGLKKDDIGRLLQESGLGFPDYYQWRSRSGCFFCFFQQRIEWVGLLETHPELFEEAMRYEKIDADTGERYTWVASESLEELARPERVAQIKAEAATRLAREKLRHRPDLTLLQMVEEDDEDSERACAICQL